MGTQLDAATERFGERLASWLLRPYIDLGGFAEGPLYARGIEEYWRAFDDPGVAFFALQRTLPLGFRIELIEETARPEYAVSDPRQLPAALRTERWQSVCDGLERWRALSVDARTRLAVLLHSLCLYDPVISLVPAPGIRLGRDQLDAIDLIYWRESARYIVGLPQKVSDYRDADLSVFEAIASEGSNAIPAGFNAAVKVFVHKAKTRAPVDELVALADRMERVHADTASRTDPFTAELLTSRFYRALALLPQRQGDRVQAVRQMDLAEQHARALQPKTSAQELLYLENLHPVMESRTKEALWLGDHDLALERALEVTQLDPYDSKAWVELGQVRRARKEWAPAAEAYAVAGMLGPPASAIGRHMAGLCFRELGQATLAAYFFKETLEIDPRGFSAREEIRKLPDVGVLRALREWGRTTVKL